MFAAHFAAGLALKGRAPRAPLPALILGAFVLDGLWIVLSVLRIDRTYYDDWSHSLVMSILWASLFSLFFRRLGRRVMCVLWLACSRTSPLILSCKEDRSVRRESCQ